MTREHLYLRPAGLVYGSAAVSVSAEGIGARLAGSEVAFTLLEVLERTASGVQRSFRNWSDLSRSTTPEIGELLARITRKRGDVAGLAMDRTHVMGIVNVTPDSFSDGGQFSNHEVAIEHGRSLWDAGATLLDVGGESTRPGSDPVDLEQERSRTMPVIEALCAEGLRVSVDTRKADIMRAAASAGAQVLNDVSALTHDREAQAVAGDLGLPVCLMHAQGDPKTMQQAPSYDDVVLDVFDWLEGRIAECERAGIRSELIIADPGIGFGKTFDHNLQLLERFSIFHGLGVPLMLGASRKAFIGALTGEKHAGNRASGSIGAALTGAMQMAQFLRVHDVKETVAALKVLDAGVRGAAATGFAGP